MPDSRNLRAASIAALLVGFASAAAVAGEQSVTQLNGSDAMLTLGTVAFQGGRTVTFNLGIGSGAFRHPSDPPNVIVTISDRGPNFPCAEARQVTGIDGKTLCHGVKHARIYPVPDYSPSIYTVRLNDDGTFTVKDAIALKDARGVPINGLLNPLTVATTENAIDGAGKPLPQNPDAVDAEGIVKLSDGSYWVSEENAPSVMHVAASGRILQRFVPAGTEKDFAGAHYEIVGALPAIFAKREGNRGLEGLAISPDERFLYTVMQNPLANPDSKAYAKARNSRILKIERATMKPVGEYIYQLADPMSFRLDPSTKQNAPRISELSALGPDRLLVLERTEGTTKLFEVTLAGATDILGGKWDDPATSPTLEQTNDLGPTGVTPVAKRLRFDSADHPTIPSKLEGIAQLGDGRIALINDSDFGISGAVTRIVVVKGMDLGAD